MAGDQPRPPLPRDPVEHRQEAERLVDDGLAGAPDTIVHALLAIAGELHLIRRRMGK
ncbi:hypothetical protein [Streptomyces sp. NPDC051665]|uniref:hypothetical protein n=1 Tax=Streptomyces sp. NPDC051665 TaxID=3154647 RepID=UPI00342ACE68